jgi:hypothetical protein
MSSLPLSGSVDSSLSVELCHPYAALTPTLSLFWPDRLGAWHGRRMQRWW